MTALERITQKKNELGQEYQKLELEQKQIERDLAVTQGGYLALEAVENELKSINKES